MEAVDSQPFESDLEDVVEDEEEDELSTISEKVTSVRKLHTLSKSSYILSKRLSGRIKQKVPAASKTWLHETASFYSKAPDTHFCVGQTHAHPTLPFCAASCNSEY